MDMTTHFLIVHGAGNNPEGNWFPWLRTELQKHGNVVSPYLPTPEGQNLTAWLAVADDASKNLSPHNTILIGHSSGALLVLRMAEKTQQPFKAVYAVCPFAKDLNNPVFDPLNESFIRPAFDWNAVKQGTKKITCYAGDDDPYVPLAYSQEVADAVKAEFIVLKNTGHINAESGYHRFPELLEHIRQSL
jgi:predicted alpha/beta hydrolase family esterase